jgi:predicted Zn finger-like uncharacterized protein
MKLKCPNCQAQYEVPDVAIPETGRDVQCANCNETWFQVPAKDTAQSRSPAKSEASDPEGADSPMTEPGADNVTELPRRELSPAVSDILRQEAAREKQARGGAVKDVQPMGNAARENSRPVRKKLPDIADVDVSNPRLNKVSKAKEEAVSEALFDVDTDTPEVPRSSGFKRGFSLVVLLMGLALVLYVFAPVLAQKFPSLLGPLQAYVDMINAGRIWLNELLSGLIGKI